KDKKVFNVLQSLPCKLKLIEKRIDEIVIGSGIQSIVPGVNIDVDDSDPLNPIVSASGGGSGMSIGGDVDGGPTGENGKLIYTDDDSKLQYIQNSIVDPNLGF